ncbi:MAG: DUF423 domain-containing protein [Akkermansiaceae bacterium]|nr:DUF423 domain-containing protein [Akkermansiaceae bacterium]NNM31215.1 DUF423 domain-containing protein [Akkermansiaceae bacterium]
MTSAIVIRLAAILGFLGVGLGAFGAHGLEELLEKNGRVDTWELAVTYHLIHAVAILAIGAVQKPNIRAVWFLVAGIVCFPGSLYLLSLNCPGWIAVFAPAGGIALLVGWTLLVWRPMEKSAG